MLIIISPTKQMKMYEDRKPETMVQFPQETKTILEVLKMLSSKEIEKLMKVNEKIAKENVARYPKIAMDMQGSCALFTYQGLQFKHMRITTQEEIAYLQKHLRILSGLYGIVLPLDSIYPYRLEMQAALPIEGCKDLYSYWKEKLACRLQEELQQQETGLILNMASKEYEKAVLPYVKEEEVVTLTFKVKKQGKLKVESTQAKMARGAMVHYLAANQVESLEAVKQFCEDGYQYQAALSSTQELVFVKEVSI